MKQRQKKTCKERGIMDIYGLQYSEKHEEIFSFIFIRLALIVIALLS